MAIAVRTLLLLATVVPFLTAVPATDAFASLNPPHHHQAPASPSSNVPSPFRRFRDAIIERIWNLPTRTPRIDCSGSRGKEFVPANYRTRYGNDVVLRFQFTTQDEVRALMDAADIMYLDLWESTDEWVDIRIAKDMVPSVLGLLPPSLQKAYAPVMHDLAQAVYDTYPSSSPSHIRGANHHGPAVNSISDIPHDLFFQDYQPLSVLYPWLRLLASMFPGHVQLTSIGRSAEGRDIAALRVGARTDASSLDDHQERHTILITGGSHAREWISVSTTAYIAYELITRYGKPHFPYVTKMLDHFDLVFIPVLNPDGYDYTWSTDRLWRKTRQETPLPFCRGIDLDRAFSFGWDGNKSYDNACSEDYAGTGPMASVEAMRLSEWARNETQKNNVAFDAFLDLHSYSQQVLYPYSFSCNAQPPNLEDLEEVALGLAKSFRVTSGHFYSVSSACQGSITLKDKTTKPPTLLQVDSQGGSALDFFYHDLHVKYAYQIKLRDTGAYGFLLPKSDIGPSGHEAYEAVVGLGKWLLGNHGIESVDTDDAWGEEPETTKQDKDSSIQEQPVEYEDEQDEVVMELKRRRRR